ncbi:MAG: tonB dependent receptor family protein [Alphaproteobacteria bacterium]|nr:tonB dependent receptor family protein [Alphaproteobacteria bacterium]
MVIKASFRFGVSLVALCGAAAAIAQGADPATAAGSSQGSVARADAGVPDIIVTAQKRNESINDVPMSISAVTGEQLARAGVVDTRDLVKLVPGFNYTESAFGTPVYTLRGVGFYETTVGAKPTVSIYLDEVPLPFSVLARGASLDLERVEVLKGPQGTLFGQNATGGAINYIAAKPTDRFSYGFDGSYARFDAIDLGGFVSGPLSDTVKARIAVKTEQGGAWQRSYTRDDELGDRDFTTGRLTLDFTPSKNLRFVFNANGFIDKSDEVAAQLLQVIPFSPAVIPFIPPALFTYPPAPHNNRAADWSPSVDPSRDHRFWQTSLRSELDLGSDFTVTSITAYSDYRHRQKIDPDGVSLRNYSYNTKAEIKAFSQELRLSGKLGDNGQFIVGGNYNHEKVHQRDDEGPYDEGGPAYQLTVFGVPPFFTYYQESRQKFKTAAVFGNVDYDLARNITLHAGVRYTDAKIDFNGCTYDDGTPSGAGLAPGFQALLNFIRGSVGLPPISIARGACVTIDGTILQPVPLVVKKLNEDNVSWRLGVDVKPSDDVLLYANVSRGYKSGSFPLLSASDVNQFNPVRQESVTAYEVGFKATLADRKAQLNAAAFYYDYKDKQLKGRVVANPNVFGPLEALINVPKSSIKGAEVQATLYPIQGLTLNAGATYIDSKIRGDFINITSYGDPGNFGGEPFAYTPKYQVIADAEYRFPVGDVEAMLGSNLSYQSKTNAAFGQLPVLAIDSYTLVDFRAGVSSADRGWTITAFVRNAFDKYYWTNATKVLDTTVRYAGRPRTFGVSFSVRQ